MWSVSAIPLLLVYLAQARPAVVRPLEQQATKARLENRAADAVKLYQQALRGNPAWAEGWFFLGSIHYDQERPKECGEAFERFTKLQPKTSAGFAFLGLCLYQTGAYAASLRALNHAEKLGLPQGEQLTDVASYHAALLYTKNENFEKAMQILSFFSRRPQIDPKIIEAAGIAALRKPIFPRELPADDRELVFRVGRAVMTASDRRTGEAARQFEEIARDFPRTPNLHFAYGSLLLGGDSDVAIATLKKELEIQPQHLPTRVILALEYLKRGDPANAKIFAEQAVRLAPGNFTTRVALGRALVDLEETEAGIRELEAAVKLEPTSPQVRIALASAYAKAGKREEASRERAEFLRLKKALEDTTVR